MFDAPPSPELLRSLARLVRGLSALFWGLPAALVVCLGTATAGWFNTFGPFGFMPALAVTGLLYYGLYQLGSFQKQERPWRNALDRAGFFALVNLGCSPFLYWWNQMPENRFFHIVVYVLAGSAIAFLHELNLVVSRLGAMLPDETLRHETRQFTTLNRSLLVVLVVFATACMYSNRIAIPMHVPPPTWFWLVRGSFALLMFLGLLPLAMTMALIWKCKEVIMESVFGSDRSDS